jgi:F-type H+-transporting ATPase subunit delta
MNTKDILAAKKYSDALVELAKDGKLTFEKISTDLNLIKDVLNQSPDLLEFLINPTTSVDVKKEIIDKVFNGEIDVLVVNFLKVLVDKGRFSIFNNVIDEYNLSLDSINNISRVNVTSAVGMSEESISRLKNKLEEKLKKNVVLDLSVDSGIVAGLVIRTGDNIIDMSLKHKLEDLSKNLVK